MLQEGCFFITQSKQRNKFCFGYILSLLIFCITSRFEVFANWKKTKIKFTSERKIRALVFLSFVKINKTFCLLFLRDNKFKSLYFRQPNNLKIKFKTFKIIVPCFWPRYLNLALHYIHKMYRELIVEICLRCQKTTCYNLPS